MFTTICHANVKVSTFKACHLFNSFTNQTTLPQQTLLTKCSFHFLLASFYFFHIQIENKDLLSVILLYGIQNVKSTLTSVPILKLVTSTLYHKLQIQDQKKKYLNEHQGKSCHSVKFSFENMDLKSTLMETMQYFILKKAKSFLLISAK